LTVILTHMIELKHFVFCFCFCTESFTKEECIILQSVLVKFNIKSTLKVRDKVNNKYRIRIFKTSMDRVIFFSKTIYAYRLFI